MFFCFLTLPSFLAPVVPITIAHVRVGVSVCVGWQLLSPALLLLSEYMGCVICSVV